MDVEFHKNNLQAKAVNVAYLKSPTTMEETLEQGVCLSRICIVLGGKDDDCLPEMMEQAHILAIEYWKKI